MMAVPQEGSGSSSRPISPIPPQLVSERTRQYGTTDVTIDIVLAPMSLRTVAKRLYII